MWCNFTLYFFLDIYRLFHLMQEIVWFLIFILTEVTTSGGTSSRYTVLVRIHFQYANGGFSYTNICAAGNCQRFTRCSIILGFWPSARNGEIVWTLVQCSLEFQERLVVIYVGIDFKLLCMCLACHFTKKWSENRESKLHWMKVT